MFVITRRGRDVALYLSIVTIFGVCQQASAQVPVQSRIDALSAENEKDEELIALLEAKARVRQRNEQIVELRTSGVSKGTRLVPAAFAAAQSVQPTNSSAPSTTAFASPASPADPLERPQANSPKPIASAEVNDPAAEQASATTEQDRRSAAEKAASEKFGGIELGAGLSFTMDVGAHDRVKKASIIDDIVRIEDAKNTRARVMFESHYFFKPKRRLLGLEPDMWGIGPFIAAQPGSDEIIEAIGFGIMLGFRRDPVKSESFNVGLGWVMDPNTQILGDGINKNQPLPGNEKDIRYKQDSQAGIMGIISFTF